MMMRISESVASPNEPNTIVGRYKTKYNPNTRLSILVTLLPFLTCLLISFLWFVDADGATIVLLLLNATKAIRTYRITLVVVRGANSGVTIYRRNKLDSKWKCRKILLVLDQQRKE